MSEIEITEGQIKRMKNLKIYSGKTDDEIRAAIEASRAASMKVGLPDRDYEERLNEKLDAMQKEYGIDMNSSNDREMLTLLAQLLIQSENANSQIRSIQNQPRLTEFDIKNVKTLGDFQRDVVVSITDLQEKLGIGRKTRKEKSTDSIPQFIDNIVSNAKNYFDRVTEKVICDKCEIEVVRYWLNFPELTSKVSYIVECPQCEEKIIYNR